MARVMLGISGGVDSSVAALLLQRDGHAVEGLFMRNWEEDDRRGPCRADEDRKDAVAVCAQLGIPFHARNFAAQYWDHVFAHFLAEYQAGRTPNPDVLCNREIKFKTFLEEARTLGADKIATGHYARVDCVGGRWRLLRGCDRNKDQSYFLHTLGQDALAATLFPVGNLEKPAVRRMARHAGLGTSSKKDSTGICFIGERNFHQFLAHYLPAQPGEIRTPGDQVVGTHDGVMYYTLGQRGGLGIGGRSGATSAPWYVIGKDVERKILYVSQGNDNHWLQSRRLVASDVNWINGDAPARAFSCTAKTRYRQPDQSCTVHFTERGCEVVFDASQRAVTRGQSVVFYQGDVCLGGGIIEATDAAFGGLGTSHNQHVNR